MGALEWAMGPWQSRSRGTAGVWTWGWGIMVPLGTKVLCGDDLGGKGSN